MRAAERSERRVTASNRYYIVVCYRYTEFRIPFSAGGERLAITGRTIEIARRGQITIPKALRDELGIEDGNRYQLRTITGGIIVLTPSPGRANSARKELKALLTGSGATLDLMLADLSSLRESKDE